MILLGLLAFALAGAWTWHKWETTKAYNSGYSRGYTVAKNECADERDRAVKAAEKSFADRAERTAREAEEARRAEAAVLAQSEKRIADLERALAKTSRRACWSPDVVRELNRQ